MGVKFTILGCGSSLGVPQADGYWGKCNPKEKKNYRTRCSAVISTKNTNTLIDTIITFLTTMLERGVVDGKREDYKSISDRLEIIRENKYHHKSNLHNEPISMLDALCGIVAKINKRKNNDLTTRQIDMFNRIVKDFSKAICKDENALNGELINMINVSDDSTTNNTFGNGLFEQL